MISIGLLTSPSAVNLTNVTTDRGTPITWLPPSNVVAMDTTGVIVLDKEPLMADRNAIRDGLTAAWTATADGEHNIATFLFYFNDENWGILCLLQFSNWGKQSIL